MHIRSYFVFIILALTVFNISQVKADQVPIDLLCGTGDFEYAGDTRFYAWPHPEYNFDSSSIYTDDYRSTINIKSAVIVKTSDLNKGDTVTIKTTNWATSVSTTKVYEFTSNSTASVGCIAVNIGSTNTPANAALLLASAITNNQTPDITAAVSGSIVYLKPAQGYLLGSIIDSDSTETKIASSCKTTYSGYKRATDTDSLATGWSKRTLENLNPELNTIYQIRKGEGINGSNCQFFGIRNFNGPSSRTFIEASIKTGSTISKINPGDLLTFRIDNVSMKDFDNLPVGTSVKYWIRISYDNYLQETQITPTANPTSIEISAPDPIGTATKSVEFKVYMYISGKTEDKTPGIYLDGAHVYVKRSADPTNYATWEYPVKRDRTVKSMLTYFTIEKHDVYESAQNFDTIMTGETNGRYVTQLKYLNPNLKVLLYKSAYVTNYADARGLDPWLIDSALGYQYVSKNHPEWLYDNDNISTNNSGFVNQKSYPTSYYTKLENSQYQQEWADKAVTVAKAWGYNGIWIDDSFLQSVIMSGTTVIRPNIFPWQVQSFVHNINLYAKQQDVEITRNEVADISKLPDKIFFDPSWTPEYPYNTSEYTSNTIDNTMNNSFQEWSFFGMKSQQSGSSWAYVENVYTEDSWLRSINNVSAVKSCNLALPDANKKNLNINVYGVDTTNDPAYGVNGWFNYALASYLLVQNDWTTIGIFDRYDYAKYPDFSITTKLGIPDGEMASINGDNYFLYRKYQPDLGTSYGGIVIVNANPAKTCSYTLTYDSMDEDGNLLASGTNITLPPHTGRIFINQEKKLQIYLDIPTQAVPGDVVDIVVHYSNITNSVAQNLVVQTVVPDYLEYVSGSAEASGGIYLSATSTVKWTVGDVPAGASGSRVFKARVK